MSSSVLSTSRSPSSRRLGLLVRAFENSQQTGDAQTTWKWPGGNLVWSQSRMSHLIVGSPSRSRLVTSQPRASKARPMLPVAGEKLEQPHLMM